MVIFSVDTYLGFSTAKMFIDVYTLLLLPISIRNITAFQRVDFIMEAYYSLKGRLI